MEVRIAYLDDDPDSLSIMERKVSGFNQRSTDTIVLTTFLNPSQFLNNVITGPEEFDAVIIDLAMPIMDGREVAKKLIDARKEITMIFLSSSINEEDEDLPCLISKSNYKISELFNRVFSLRNRWLYNMLQILSWKESNKYAIA